MVSEQGDFLTTQNGTKVDWSGGLHGILIGSYLTTWSNATNVDARGFAMTTIRYQINQKTGWTDGGDCGNQGVCSNWGQNIPLTSTHTGGVMGLFGDASVRFVPDTIPILSLSRIATRDDGTPDNFQF